MLACYVQRHCFVIHMRPTAMEQRRANDGTWYSFEEFTLRYGRNAQSMWEHCQEVRSSAYSVCANDVRTADTIHLTCFAPLLYSTASRYCFALLIRSIAPPHCSVPLLRFSEPLYYSTLLFRSTAPQYYSAPLLDPLIRSTSRSIWLSIC